jgi:hypothetical protein
LALVQPAGQQPSPFAQAVCTPSSTQLAVQAAADPISFLRMQPFHMQVAGQLDGGSQVSPVSTAPLPHLGEQSLSMLALQAGGQQPSPAVHAVCATSSTHWAWQVPPLTSRRCWQPMAGHEVGQLVSGSHVSPQVASIWPLPQVQLQSLSVAVVQPDGQQPSPDAQVVCGPSSTHLAVQLAAVPVSLRFVHPIGAQVVGQLPGGSQLSPASTTPLPQEATQSLSLVALQPGGQQPSPLMHAVCRRSSTHWAVQVPGLATRRSMQPTGAHDVGQVDSGSQTSPQALSTTPLPQVQLQSESCAAVQPDGQQASPDAQAVAVPLSMQMALQVAAAPCSSYVSHPTCGQLDGHIDGGSHVSPGSSVPLPQVGAPPSPGESTGESMPASLTAFSICWTAASGSAAAHPFSLQQTESPGFSALLMLSHV